MERIASETERVAVIRDFFVALLRRQGGAPAVVAAEVEPPVVDRRAIAADPRWREGEAGELAAFTYVDAHGEVTDRRVRGWWSEGAYIRGVCLARHATRTFRKDRIEDWTAL